MQNSNLSTNILPSLSASWDHFIELVNEELDRIKIANRKNASRTKELESHLARINAIKLSCDNNNSEIFNHRTFLQYIDPSLDELFNALEFFRNINNFDNDAVKMIYHKIMNSPAILDLDEKHSSLAIKLNFAKDQVRPFEELIRGKKINQAFIKELLDKFNLDDKTKKDVLMYSIVALAIRQNELKSSKEDATNRKREKALIFQNRIKELCTKYLNKKNENSDLYIKCFDVYQGMSKEEKDTCEGYMANPSEAKNYGFSDDIILKIYIMSFFKVRKDIEEYIESLSEIQMEKNNLGDDIAFLEELIKEFDDISKNLYPLLQKNNKEEDNNEINNVFFALNTFRNLLTDPELLISNRSSINAFINNVNNSNNHLISGVNVNTMLGVEEAENILNKRIRIVSHPNYKFAYVMVDNAILILAIGNNSSEKFSKLVNRLVRDNAKSLLNQIAYISEKNIDYLDLQNEIKERYLTTKEDNKII